MMLWSTTGLISWMKPGAKFFKNSSFLKILKITTCSWGLGGLWVQLSGCQGDTTQSRMTRKSLGTWMKNGITFGLLCWKMGLGLFQMLRMILETTLRTILPQKFSWSTLLMTWSVTSLFLTYSWVKFSSALQIMLRIIMYHLILQSCCTLLEVTSNLFSPKTKNFLSTIQESWKTETMWHPHFPTKNWNLEVMRRFQRSLTQKGWDLNFHLIWVNQITRKKKTPATINLTNFQNHLLKLRYLLKHPTIQFTAQQIVKGIERENQLLQKMSQNLRCQICLNLCLVKMKLSQKKTQRIWRKGNQKMIMKYLWKKKME